MQYVRLQCSVPWQRALGSLCFERVRKLIFPAMESNSRRVQQQQPDDLTNIEFETSEDVKVIPTFDSMHLRDDLLRGIYAYGISLSLNSLALN